MPEGLEQTQDIDVDQLLADVEAGNEINATEETPQVPTAQAQAAPQTVQEMEFTWNGKPIKAPVDRFKQWASQGYDYAQRMQDFNAKQAAFEKSQKEFEPLRTRYSELDEYAKENPQWLEHVNQQYFAAIGQASQQGNIPEIQALKKELQDLKSFKEQLTTERTQAQYEQEDQKLGSEIQSIQEKYKDLDWKTPNEHGKTMEVQVLEFGIQNGIKNFEQAFKLLNHDSLINFHSSKAKEDKVRNKQAQLKSGLLGSTPAPTKQVRPATNVKNKSYNDLTREALEEYGVS
jgi:hypothetical protein